MFDASNDAGAASPRRNTRYLAHLLVAAIGMSVLATGAGGCTASPQPRMLQGSFSASPLITRSYGISQWRTLYGSNWMIVAGHDASGNAVRGIEMSWFASTATTPGYTRLKMLDGSGSTLRRFVGGGESGHLSTAQIAFIQAARSDLTRPGASLRDPLGSSKPKAVPTRSELFRSGGVQLGGSRTALLSTNPSEGPLCTEAWLDPGLVVDGIGCAIGVATFETGIGAIEAFGSCTLWLLEMRRANQICHQENQTSCRGEPPTCDFEHNPTTPPASDPPPACDERCICANYGIYDGKPCLQTCVADSGCPAGQTCHWGSCAPPGPEEALRDEHLEAVGSNPSCGGGSAAVDPATGEVSCVASGEGSAPGSAPSADDPGIGGGLTCAGIGESCDPSGICCIGECTGGQCPNMDFSFDLPACKFAGDSCTADWECCGRGEVCLGTCTSGGEDTCKSIDASCTGDDECCTLKCDETSQTCAL